MAESQKLTRAEVAEKVHEAIRLILAQMSDQARATLLEKLEELSAHEAAQLAGEQLRARALVMRRRLSSDREAADALLKRPIQRLVVGDDHEAAIKEVQRRLTQADTGIISADAMGRASLDDVGKAEKLLRDGYDKLERLFEWEAFAAAVDNMRAAELRLRTEAAEKAQADLERAAKHAEDLVARRNANIIKSQLGGPGADANVKCIMILSDGYTRTGRSGWKQRGGVLHPAIVDLFRDVRPKGAWDTDVCAEVDALNLILGTQFPLITLWTQIPGGIMSRAFEWRSQRGVLDWQSRLACGNCSQWLARIGADFLS